MFRCAVYKLKLRRVNQMKITFESAGAKVGHGNGAIISP
uniref:Uncharacterized protein n=1 Tax=Rhizobium leguminosarum bv. viciae TaxID=387 RepID=A0A0U3AUA7_RHILV|nr:hypothetical protein [Rhizobium leguminosarum bv. viciae]